MELSASIQDCTDFDANDGSIAVTVSFPNSTPVPITYLWSSGQTTPSITVAAGTYTVTVTSATSSVSGTYVVKQPLIWDTSNVPYKVGLLSDTITRDVFCRKATCKSILQRGTLPLTHDVQDYFGSKIASWNYQADRINLDMYTANQPHSILQISNGGIVCDGDFTVTGLSTEVAVATVKVVDKTIVLADGTANASELDGSGFYVGSDAATSRSILYDAANDAFTLDASLRIGSSVGPREIRIGSEWSTASVFGDHYFTAFNKDGTAGIRLTEAGLFITGATSVDSIENFMYTIKSGGFSYTAPVDSSIHALSYEPSNSTWTSGSDGFSAPSFLCGGAVLTPTSLTIGDTVFGENGVIIGDSISVNDEGIDVSGESFIYLGDRAWRIRYDQTKNTINFERFNSSTSAYVSKLTLD